ARENAGRGRAEAALPLAHEALIRLQSLHGRLEEFQNRWERARAQACSLLEALLGAVDANRTFTLKLAGEALETLPDPPALETAFWSNGRFEALERELLGRLHTLRNDAMPPTLEMVGACGAFAANAGALLTDILQEAHDAALASVQRSDLQDGFYEKLREAGYALVD
ncbi:MAG TPA: hypothetical protein P5069_17375, partial [Candidatus Hydrogenedentes bacterium]|nr:hypothetical protein [Candidatus Hydrogenedentota bacterium]